MDWLLRAFSALRALRDLPPPRGPAPAPPPVAPRPADDLHLGPIGPARPPPPAPVASPPPAPPPRVLRGLSVHQIDRDALDVTRRLKRQGYAAYLVGGCVRDLYLGLSPKDFDVATSARPEEIRAVFRNCRIIGRRFRLAHVYFRGGKIIETSTFRAAVPMADDDAADDLLIRRDNVFGTEVEDAHRRDFTVNALFFDPSSERIIDHVGGKADLDRRVVRMIGDPHIRLREDPVRIIRAARFAAKADLTIDPLLREAMREHKRDIHRCASPRLLEETLKYLRTGFAEKSVRTLAECEVLDAVFPELDAEIAAGRGERMFAFLRALDRVARRGGVDDAIVLAAAVSSTLFAAEEERGTEGLLEAQAKSFLRIGATRRLSEGARQALLAQRHLRPREGARRKNGAANLAQRAYFSDALDLFEIWSIALGRHEDEVKTWRERSAGRRRAH